MTGSLGARERIASSRRKPSISGISISLSTTLRIEVQEFDQGFLSVLGATDLVTGGCRDLRQEIANDHRGRLRRVHVV